MSSARWQSIAKMERENAMRIYRSKSQRYELILKRSKLVEEYVALVTTAFGRLFKDEHFVALIQAQGITDMPEPLAMRLKQSKTPPPSSAQKLASLARQARVAEQTYARDVLTLSVLRAYVNRLLDIAKITEYLSSFHPDILASLQSSFPTQKPNSSNGTFTSRGGLGSG